MPVSTFPVMLKVGTALSAWLPYHLDSVGMWFQQLPGNISKGKPLQNHHDHMDHAQACWVTNTPSPWLKRKLRVLKQSKPVGNWITCQGSQLACTLEDPNLRTEAKYANEQPKAWYKGRSLNMLRQISQQILFSFGMWTGRTAFWPRAMYSSFLAHNVYPCRCCQ